LQIFWPVNGRDAVPLRTALEDSVNIGVNITSAIAECAGQNIDFVCLGITATCFFPIRRNRNTD